MTDAEAVVRDLVDRVWNAGDLDALPDLYAEEFTHDGTEGSLAQLRAWHEAEGRTWSDVTYEILECVVDGDRVAVRWRNVATLVGDWGPVSGTGQRVTGSGVHFFTVHDGRITAVDAMSDVFGKAEQLGVRFLPPAEDEAAELEGL